MDTIVIIVSCDAKRESLIHSALLSIALSFTDALRPPGRLRIVPGVAAFVHIVSVVQCSPAVESSILFAIDFSSSNPAIRLINMFSCSGFPRYTCSCDLAAIAVTINTWSLIPFGCSFN